MAHLNDYPFEITPLTAADGGGFLITYTDFDGCISDGETAEQALANGREALAATIATLKKHHLPIPTPHSGTARRRAS